MDTIYGLATVMGKSGVAVLRISGGRSLEALKELGISPPPPRLARVAALCHPLTKELLDKGLVIYFKAPHSFTGEDVVELHIHGGLAVINDTIMALQSLTFLRLAEPGEFSKRAFKAGKLDLTAAEGLAALIDAETTMQRKLALRQYGGELASLYENWRSQLVNCLAHLEALIDFPEEDIPQSLIQQIKQVFINLQQEIEKHLQNSRHGEALVRGIHVAIVGKPNVGKSSLINWLVKRDAAIVSEIAGTTRDVLELRLDIAGFPITIKDTAGMRNAQDLVEIEGIRRARAAMVNADIIILMLDANEIEHEGDALLLSEAIATGAEVIILLNKIDLLDSANKNPAIKTEEVIHISLRTGDGLVELMGELTDKLRNTYTPSSEPVLTKARYRQELVLCLEYLQRFCAAPTLEIACEEVRLAASHLGAITGRVEVEEVLDIIFSSFCIGK